MTTVSKQRRTTQALFLAHCFRNPVLDLRWGIFYSEFIEWIFKIHAPTKAITPCVCRWNVLGWLKQWRREEGMGRRRAQLDADVCTPPLPCLRCSTFNDPVRVTSSNCVSFPCFLPFSEEESICMFQAELLFIETFVATTTRTSYEHAPLICRLDMECYWAAINNSPSLHPWFRTLTLSHSPRYISPSGLSWARSNAREVRLLSRSNPQTS